MRDDTYPSEIIEDISDLENLIRDFFSTNEITSENPHDVQIALLLDLLPSYHLDMNHYGYEAYMEEIFLPTLKGWGYKVKGKELQNA